MATTAVGYSGTPLPKKLGLKEGGVMVLLNAPLGFEQWVQPLPIGATLVSKLAASNALVVLFCKDTAALKKIVAECVEEIGSRWQFVDIVAEEGVEFVRRSHRRRHSRGGVADRTGRRQSLRRER